MTGHIWWQWFSHYWYVMITIFGSAIVLGIVFWQRNRGRYKKARD